MFAEPTAPAGKSPLPRLGDAVERAIERLYGRAGAQAYGITRDRFQEIVGAVVSRYAAGSSEAEQLEIVGKLWVEELTLARACSAGNEVAWAAFIARFRAPLYATALRLTRDETGGRELADELNADLYGIPESEGRRISKLDYYMGRGSLEGWLRTVLARQYIDRRRARSKEVSLEEQIEEGVAFVERPQTAVPVVDERVSHAIAQTLAELGDEERLLLASYYLDQRTLADIGRQMGVHESTVSRKVEKLTGTLRKRVKKRMQAAGIDTWRCNEMLSDLDVRDIDVDVEANLKQEKPVGSF
jgi:RNA polymerase sigma-70 factor, ECF subfamily